MVLSGLVHLFVVLNTEHLIIGAFPLSVMMDYNTSDLDHQCLLSILLQMKKAKSDYSHID